MSVVSFAGGERDLTILSVLDGEHSNGDGIFGFLSPQDSRSLLVVCKEMNKAVLKFKWRCGRKGGCQGVIIGECGWCGEFCCEACDSCFRKDGVCGELGQSGCLMDANYCERCELAFSGDNEGGLSRCPCEMLILCEECAGRDGFGICETGSYYFHCYCQDCLVVIGGAKMCCDCAEEHREAGEREEIVIDGVKFWMVFNTKELYLEEEEGEEAVGFYQPENEEEPIRWIV